MRGAGREWVDIWLSVVEDGYGVLKVDFRDGYRVDRRRSYGASCCRHKCHYFDVIPGHFTELVSPGFYCDIMEGCRRFYRLTVPGRYPKLHLQSYVGNGQSGHLSTNIYLFITTLLMKTIKRKANCD